MLSGKKIGVASNHVPDFCVWFCILEFSLLSNKNVSKRLILWLDVWRWWWICWQQPWRIPWPIPWSQLCFLLQFPWDGTVAIVLPIVLPLATFLDWTVALSRPEAVSGSDRFYSCVRLLAALQGHGRLLNCRRRKLKKRAEKKAVERRNPLRCFCVPCCGVQATTQGREAQSSKAFVFLLLLPLRIYQALGSSIVRWGWKENI